VPDSNLADGAVLTSSFYNTYIREQVVTTCTSVARPTGVEGRLIYETDTDKLMLYTGSAWTVLGGTAWASFTPSWANVTAGTGATNVGRWRYIDGDLEFIASLTFGTGGSVSGSVTITLPNSLSGATGMRQVAGSIMCSLSGANHPGVAFVSGGTVASLYVGTNDVAATNPFTWAGTAVLDVHCRVVLD